MLKNRIVTALILAPLIIFAILELPALWFAVVWGAFIAVGAFEWANLAGVPGIPARVGFAAALAAIMLTGPHWAEYALEWLPWVVVAWWFGISVALRRYPSKLLEIQFPMGLRLFVGVFVLLSAWILMVWLRTNFGEWSVLYLCLLIWLADIAAYFAGKQWGKTPLAPEISPGKTVEGLYAGLLAAALFAFGVGLFKGFQWMMIADFVFISVITAVISVVGDLFESWMKRVRGVKDSGTLLPGHGGLLDRIDSLIAAVSIFYAGSAFKEIFLQ